MNLPGAWHPLPPVCSTGQEYKSAVRVTRKEITINISQTVVMVVDMQNDFCSKGGLFDRAGVNVSTVQKAVGPTRKVLLAAREAGIKIVYLKMGFRPDLSDLGATDSPNRVRHLQLGVGQPCLAP
jgi:ureidoacrylate peracid hydrolase